MMPDEAPPEQPNGENESRNENEREDQGNHENRREEEKLNLKNQDSKRKHIVWKSWKEGEESDWWLASTGIPLLAATLGPLANVSSIAALVTPWRQYNIIDGEILTDFQGEPFSDPRWCYWINVASLICGFLGNLFLLLNFTQRIRYIIALPATIILWYLSSGFLIAITVCMNAYAPPDRPTEGYTQGFWYAIAAAIFYTICSMILMVNMLGYALGHYPQNFALSDSQRTLILQTMSFFIWLGGGAAIFSALEQDGTRDSWSFSDALYFCDVTILTVGFGDLVPSNDVARGIVFPYSVGGTITLALVVSALYNAVRELGEGKVVQKHIDRKRKNVKENTVTTSFDYRHREREHNLPRNRKKGPPQISGPTEPRPYHTPMGESVRHTSTFPRIAGALGFNKKPKIMLLKEEKDRFEAMRKIQADSRKFKQWIALFWSVSTFTILWCVGAVVFWQTEANSSFDDDDPSARGLSYFQSLYFCYVSLLTIGYGDLAPRSNSGRCFFVIWSLIAVPTMTILVSDLGDTVIAKFKKWSDELADFTVLPKSGIWRSFLEKHPWLLTWLQRWTEKRAEKKRLKRGFEVGPEYSSSSTTPTPNESFTEDIERDPPNLPALEADLSIPKPPPEGRASLSRRLAMSIKTVSMDLKEDDKRYTYEEWVEFTRLIRLTTPEELDRDLGAEPAEDENEEGLVNWDWIGKDSPMVSGVSESVWLMERLLESLVRLERRKEVAREMGDVEVLRRLEARAFDGGGEMDGEERKG